MQNIIGMLGVLMKTLNHLLSSQEASPAKIFQSRAKGLDWKEKGQVFGQRCLELLGFYDQNTHSLKTSQCSFIEDFQESYLILPVSGMMRNGKLYRQKMLEHGILESESSLLPTPTASDGTTGSIIGENDTYIKLESGRIRKYNKNGKDGSLGLGRHVKFFPTPKVMDHADSLNSGKDTIVTDSGSFCNVRKKDGMRFGASLNEVVKLYPTPVKSDSAGRRPTENWKGNDLASQVSLIEHDGEKIAKLNPDWVDWLMGFPIKWEDIDSDEYNDTFNWTNEPDIPRITTNNKNRIERLKCLGNAVVPQVAELIGTMIRKTND